MTTPSGPAMIIDPDAAIPLPAGEHVRADIFRPDGREPVPAIATLGPYGKDVPLSRSYPQLWPQLLAEHPDVVSASSGRYLVWERPDPERWTAAGYAVVNIDAPGTGTSPGTWSPMSRPEAGSFAAAVDWIGSQPWCTGRVAVLGVSYHAMAAWRVAEQQPAHLAAIVPWYGAGDAFREAWRHGGILSNVFTDAWWYRWAGRTGRG